MEILRFAKWYWQTASGDGKVLIVAVTNIILIPTVGAIFGAKIAAIVFFSEIVVGLIIFLFSLFFRHINKNWKKYKLEKEKEACDIMDILRGGTRRRFNIKG